MRIDEADAVIKKTAHENDACRRLVPIPGIGPVTATALIAAIGNGGAFHKGREFAAWMGWFHANTQPAASRSCSVSASVVAPICEPVRARRLITRMPLSVSKSGQMNMRKSVSAFSSLEGSVGHRCMSDLSDLISMT
jgi:hypothetical protein